MKDCIFCKIVAGDISSDTVFANEKVIVIRDIAPQAPYHFLIIPKQHLDNLYDPACEKIMADVACAARSVARQMFDQEQTDGFRLVCNTGPNGGQTVGHLHFHLLGGRNFNWPPG